MANGYDEMSTSSEYMNEKIKLLELEERQVLNIVEELEDKTKQIQKNSDKAIQQVTLFASQLTTAINQSKKKLLQDIDGLKNRLLTKVKKAKALQQSRIKDIQKARERLNKLLQTLSGTDELVHDLLNKDGHVLRYENKCLDPSIRFYPSEEALDLKTLDIGNVYIIEDVDYLQSFLEVSQTKFEALSMAHMTLQTNTTDNRPCIVPVSYVDIDVCPYRYVEKLTVVERKAGKFAISFSPKICGKFIIHAKVNGKNVQNSPFTMTVEPQTLKIIREIDVRAAGLKCPCGIAVTKNFTKIAVSDAESHCLVILRSNGDLIKTIGQVGTKQGKLSCPDGIAFLDESELAVADRDNHRVQVFNTVTGKFISSIGKKSRTTNKPFKSPWGVSIDNDNDIVVSDTYNHRIQIFHRKTMQLVKEYSFRQDHDELAVLPSRTVCYKHLLLVADALENDIHIIDQSDGPISTIETKGGRDSIIKSLNGIAISSDGNIGVCDQDDGSVKLFDLQGNFIGKTQVKLSPIDMVSLPDGSFLVIDGSSGKLLVINVNMP